MQLGRNFNLLKKSNFNSINLKSNIKVVSVILKQLKQIERTNLEAVFRFQLLF